MNFMITVAKQSLQLIWGCADGYTIQNELYNQSENWAFLHWNGGGPDGT